MAVKVYLAGPDVFLPNAREVGTRKQAICGEFGLDGLFPLDNDPGVNDAAAIFRANCDLMRQADIGLVNLTPFRGPSADPGTVFELGFLFSSGKPVYGYSGDVTNFLARVRDARGPIQDDNGQPRDRDSLAVENFALIDNLMIARSIEDSGGAVTVVPAAMAPTMAAFEAFRASAALIAERVKRGIDRPPPAAADTKPKPTAPAFEFEGGHKNENFNLRPKPDWSGPVPTDQSGVSQQVYAAANVLKLLHQQKEFGTDEKTYKEFVARILQAGEAGCVAANVQTKLASDALDQIRADIIRRVGRRIVFKYLLGLAEWAFVGIAVAVVAIFLTGRAAPGPPLHLNAVAGYGWVFIGAMVGAWLSVAMTWRNVSFDDLQDFVRLRREPVIRMLFAVVLALVFALFLRLQFITLKIGTADLGAFAGSASLALAVGIIAGIGQKALSVQIIDRVTKVLSPAGPNPNG